MTHRIMDIAVGAHKRPTDLPSFCRLVHRLNEKWWLNPMTGERIQRNNRNMFSLMLTEVGEAVEGERKNLADDKLPHRPMAEVEIADVVIRLADYIGGRKIVIRDLRREWGDQGRMPWSVFTPDSDRGEMLFMISSAIVDLDNPYSLMSNYSPPSAVLYACEQYCLLCKYDLWGAVWEKLEFNIHREDHKLEARQEGHGKRW